MLDDLIKTTSLVVLTLTNVAMLCSTDRVDVVVFSGTGATLCALTSVAHVYDWARQTWGEDG